MSDPILLLSDVLPFAVEIEIEWVVVIGYNVLAAIAFVHLWKKYREWKRPTRQAWSDEWPPPRPRPWAPPPPPKTEPPEPGVYEDNAGEWQSGTSPDSQE